jgi:alkylation response protein AidB-like acyl-CoA dehydrogenase
MPSTARQWALQRKQFGRPAREFQGLQWKFADMKMKLDAGQLLLYRAAANADAACPRPRRPRSPSSSATRPASKSQRGDAGDGRHGLQPSETLVEYCFRKCRGWMIAGGSIEILKNRIAEGVFERTFSQRPPRA